MPRQRAAPRAVHPGRRAGRRLRAGRLLPQGAGREPQGRRAGQAAAEGPPRRRQLADTLQPVEVDAGYEERYWYPDDGGQVWVAGYQLIDRESGRYLARGLRVVGVAGAGRHHADALESGAAAPGSPLELRRDPANEHDANAIAVHAGDGQQVGWVPRELAAELATALDSGEEWSAVVLREQRRSPRDPRHGLTMLLAPA